MWQLESYHKHLNVAGLSSLSHLHKNSINAQKMFFNSCTTTKNHVWEILFELKVIHSLWWWAESKSGKQRFTLKFVVFWMKWSRQRTKMIISMNSLFEKEIIASVSFTTRVTLKWKLATGFNYICASIFFITL